MSGCRELSWLSEFVIKDYKSHSSRCLIAVFFVFGRICFYLSHGMVVENEIYFNVPFY